MLNPLTHYFDPASWKENRCSTDLPSAKSAYKEVMQIALPAIAETILISLINSVDMMMVGMLGKDAISAVGLTGQPRLVILCFFTALNVGISALCARRKGENNREKANITLHTAIAVALALSLLLMALSVVFTIPLLKLAGGSNKTPENALILEKATDYFRIMMFALPFNALSLAVCAAQRGIGRTKITFYVNALSNLINVVFNFLLIEGHWGFPRLEVRGAAIASDIGILMGCIFAMMTVVGKKKKNQFLQCRLRDMRKINRATLASIVKISGNALIEQFGMRIGFFIVGRIYFTLGTIVFAAHQICMQVLNLTFSFGDGLAVASTAMVGRSLGKQRPDLALLYGKICQRCAVIISIILFLILLPARQFIVGLYINADTPDAAQVIAVAADTMIVLACAQPFQINAFTIAGGLRGAGDNLFVAIVASISVTLIRPAMAFVAVYLLHANLAVIWIMAQFEMVLRCLLMYPRFTAGKWKDIKI